ncbi:MAG: uroporphyrinogen-III decarboxylase [Kiritimatiellae bacterium]|nr:uroporphyrinogen-III decarboxylase [Kiritimatiellia bacterium]
MTPRDRVAKALNHEEPDKIPVDLNGTLVTALTRIAYNNLREYLGMAPHSDPSISSREMDTVRAADDLLEHYAIDTRCIHLKAPLLAKGREMPDGSYYDAFGIRWRKAAYYYDAIERPLVNATIDDLPDARWPDAHDKGMYQGLREEAKALYENTDYCLVADIPGLGPFEGCCFVRGHDNFCVDLYTDPKFAEALLDKITDYIIAVWDHFLGEVGEYVQVVAQGDDVGIQTGPFISPAMYRKFVKPRQKRMWDFIHSKTQAKIFYHSCGSVYDLLPDFIDAGIDILNPVQRSAAKMDLATLKREFGDSITFWGGGIDVQTQLPFLSVEEIEDEVRRTIDILAPGGGFVFFPSHNIQADVSPDRIDRTFRAVLEHGAYSGRAELAAV